MPRVNEPGGSAVGQELADLALQVELGLGAGW